jgi:release factor glutamine methyltransferase
MNANLPPKAPAIKAWLKDAAEQLAEIGITTALLDAEVILAHTLKKSRTYLHAHGDDTLSYREYDIANARLDLRLDRTPIAYIIGHKEFYGRSFKVSPATLIPRPESEALIELLKKHLKPTAKTLIDIGTGSGCLGITAKLEHPSLNVTVTDVSRYALAIAKENADNLHADITIIKSDLLYSAATGYSCLIANLPYVDREWERSPETSFEPELALFAEDNGAQLIFKLLEQVPLHILPNGLILLEADPYQHDRIISKAAEHGMTHIETLDYAVAFLFSGTNLA